MVFVCMLNVHVQRFCCCLVRYYKLRCLNKLEREVWPFDGCNGGTPGALEKTFDLVHIAFRDFFQLLNLI